MMKTFNNVINQHLWYTYYVPGTILTALPELFHLIPSSTVQQVLLLPQCYRCGNRHRMVKKPAQVYRGYKGHIWTPTLAVQR